MLFRDKFLKKYFEKIYFFIRALSMVILNIPFTLNQCIIKLNYLFENKMNLY